MRLAKNWAACATARAGGKTPALAVAQAAQFFANLIALGLRFQLYDPLLALTLLVLALGLEQQEAALLGPELMPLLPPGFDLNATHLAIGHLLAQRLVAGHPIAGDLVDSKVLVQILEIILLYPSAKH